MLRSFVKSKTATQKKASVAQLRMQKGKTLISVLLVDQKKFHFYKTTMSVHFVADVNDLSLPKTCTTDFPDPDDLLKFKLIICPDEGKCSFWFALQKNIFVSILVFKFQGFYKKGRFVFNFEVNSIRNHIVVCDVFSVDHCAIVSMRMARK